MKVFGNSYEHLNCLLYSNCCFCETCRKAIIFVISASLLDLLDCRQEKFYSWSAEHSEVRMLENEPTYLQRRVFPSLMREQRVRVRYSYATEEEKSSEDQSSDMKYSRG